MPKTNPVAVLISDIHYNISTLQLADASMRQAIAKANELRVPLIVAGDMHDTKANLRAECVNAIIETFRLCRLTPIVMIGNHDKINEKSKEHALTFIEEFTNYIVNKPRKLSVKIDEGYFDIGYCIPYHHNPDELRAYLKTIPKGSTLIMHQGITGSNSGEYIQDKSAITKNDVAGFRVISGHYHTRQTIDLPDGGKWDYIGNPYTLNFAESNDPEKGFQILMDDGSLEFVPTNLRKHVVINTEVYDLVAVPYQHKSGDLLWFKVAGTKEELAGITKDLIANNYGIEEGFRLDLIPTDNKTQPQEQKTLTKVEQLDYLIEQSNTTAECKSRLKQTWRDMV